MNIKHTPRLLAVIAAASLIGLAGPAASAAVDPVVTPEPSAPVVVVEDPADDAACTVVVKPERTLKNGKVIAAKTRVDQACKQALREERQETRTEERQERAELRDQVREAGGSWGAVVRQETLIRVATKFAERHEQAPTSAALGRILTLINAGLPEALQFDIDAFLAQYNLVFADLIKVTDDEDDVDVEDEDDEDDDEAPGDDIEPSPSPSA